MIEWRSDLENAPRDSTEILIRNNNLARIVSWDKQYCSDCVGWMIVNSDDDQGSIMFNNPTHWAEINL